MHDIFDIFSSLLTKDNIQNLKKCDVLLCCHDVDRGINLNGKAFSPLIDSIHDELTRSGWICAQFAHPFSYLIGDKAWGEPTSMNRKMLRNRSLIYIYRLMEKTGIKLESKLVKWLLSLEEELYEELFNRAECQAVISIGSPATMCKVANRKNIILVELLHGIGYTSIPWGWDQRDPMSLPKGIFSLDNISTQTFSTLKDKGVDIIQIPHPWYKRFIDPELEKLLDLQEEWRARIEWLIQDKRKKVLLSLQWGYDNEFEQFRGILSNGVIHETLLQAIESTQNTVIWLIRLHPVQIRKFRYNHHRKFIRDLCKRFSNCEWQFTSSLPLPILLRQCDSHVTMSSMTAYDAAFFGVPSLLLCPTLKEGGFYSGMFQDLKAMRYATLGSLNVHDIVGWIESTGRIPITPFQSLLKHDWNYAVRWMLGRSHKALPKTYYLRGA